MVLSLCMHEWGVLGFGVSHFMGGSVAGCQLRGKDAFSTSPKARLVFTMIMADLEWLLPGLVEIIVIS